VKIRIGSVLAGAAALAFAGGILVGAGSAAYAAVTPGWEPDASALGSITFYDASGNVVTSGSLSANPVAVYAVASGPGRNGDTKAQLYAYTPQVGVNPSVWSGDSLTASTNYPVTDAGTPPVIANATNPVVTGTPSDFSFNDYIGEFPNVTTDPAYQNLYELRLYTAGPNQSPSAAYYRTDVQVDSVAGTWTVVYPAPAATTTTTLTGNPPAGSVAAGTSVTLTATVASGGTGPFAGGVHFFDGTTDLGAATYDPTTGVATAAVTIDAGTTHSYTAQFTPTDPTAFVASTSDALSYSAPGTTSTALTGSRTAGKVPAGSKVTLTATVASGGTGPFAGSVHFFDGTTDLGAATYDPTTGVATAAVTIKARTAHCYTAQFTPTNPATFTASTSGSLTYWAGRV
jgi:hypothetical protein